MWRVEFRPEFQSDVAEAADWYDQKQPGLGADFIEEVIRVLDSLAQNPELNSRRHSSKNIRWRLPSRFPYRIVYEIDAAVKVVVVIAALHTARHNREWFNRIT